MILTRVLFNYSDDYKKLSYKSRFIAHHYIGNEWFSLTEFCSTILMNSKNYPTNRDFIAHHYIGNEWFSLEFCSTILINSKKIILQIEIHRTSLHSKWMILSRVLFNYSDKFKKLFYKSRFIAHLHRKWMILINNRVLFNYSDEFKKLSYKSRFIAQHYIGNEWFSGEFCSTILMNSKSLSYKSRFIAHHYIKWMILIDQSSVQLF